MGQELTYRSTTMLMALDGVSRVRLKKARRDLRNQYLSSNENNDNPLQNLSMPSATLLSKDGQKICHH